MDILEKRKPKFIYLFFLLVALFGTAFFFFTQKENNLFLSSYPIEPPLPEAPKDPLFWPKEIESPVSYPLPDLQEEFSLHTIPVRKDHPKGSEWKLFVGDSKKWLEVNDGDTLHFSPIWKEGKLSLALGSKAISARVKKVGEGIQLEVKSPEAKEISFFLPLKGIYLQDLAKEPFGQEIKTAKLWEEDKLKKLIDPESVLNLRVEFLPEQSSSYFCSLQEGSLLIYKDDQWLSAHEEDTKNFPIARFTSIGGKGYHFQVWDVEGNYMEYPVLPGSSSPIKTPKESLFLAAKLKTLNKVACSFEKDFLILRTGDFVLRSEKGWRVLSRAEVEDLSSRDVEGDLFYFDSVKMEKGQKVLHGYLMNGMRTQIEEIQVSVHQKKEKPLPKRKKSIKRDPLP